MNRKCDSSKNWEKENKKDFIFLILAVLTVVSLPFIRPAYLKMRKSLKISEINIVGNNGHCDVCFIAENVSDRPISATLFVLTKNRPAGLSQKVDMVEDSGNSKIVTIELDAKGSRKFCERVNAFAPNSAAIMVKKIVRH